jgi:octaprenyl-diphosphate synthase
MNKKIFEKIQTPIIEEMQILEKKLHEFLHKTQVTLLDRINKYVFRNKGKKIRPMLIFLTAKMLGNVVEKTHNIALFSEIIHTAMLIHDDLVDESLLRRGDFSVHSLWKNKIAVLVGDYLLSKSFFLLTENNYYDLLNIFNRVICQISKGELLQIEKSRMLDITEKLYEEIIYYKTASMISVCCEVGAISTNADENSVFQMREFGKYIGMAFQIRDDLFDYECQNLLGKPIGIDIKGGKMTLPLIHVFEKSSLNRRKWIINTIKNKDEKRVKELIHYVKYSGGIDYATEKMIKFCKKAFSILDKYPENKAKKSLKMTINYVVT